MKKRSGLMLLHLSRKPAIYLPLRNKVDLTPPEHAVAMDAAQHLAGVSVANWWIGGVVGCCWFIARERTQAEYRWIEKFG